MPDMPEARHQGQLFLLPGLLQEELGTTPVPFAASRFSWRGVESAGFVRKLTW